MFGTTWPGSAAVSANSDFLLTMVEPYIQLCGLRVVRNSAIACSNSSLGRKWLAPNDHVVDGKLSAPSRMLTLDLLQASRSIPIACRLERLKLFSDGIN